MNASQLKIYFDPDVERVNIAQLQDLQAQNQQPVDTQDTRYTGAQPKHSPRKFKY